MDPLWILPLTELRALLHYPLPTLSSLFLLIQRLLTSFPFQLLPSDFHLLIHHLALHQEDEGQLHSITAIALRLYDDYAQRQGWPPLPGAVMRDLLTLTSRAAEAEASLQLLERMEAGGIEGVGVAEYNLVLWAMRQSSQQRLQWWRSMGEKSASAPFINAESLLVALHAHVASHTGATRLRFYAWLASRTEEYLHRCLQSSTTSPTLPLLLSQLSAFTDSYLSSAAVQSNVAKVVAELRWRLGPEFLVPKSFQWEKTVTPLYLQLTLHRVATSLGVALPLTAVRQLSLRVEAERRRGNWKLGELLPKSEGGEAVSIGTALLCAGLNSELRVRLREVGEEVREGNTRSLLWQAVLAAYERKLSQGVEVTLADSLEAIVACYRGQHWQRAVELLVMPLYTTLPPDEVKGLVTKRPSPVSPQSSPSAVTALPAVASVTTPSTPPTPVIPLLRDEDEYIDLSPVTGEWTGPQSHRIDFASLLQNFTPHGYASSLTGDSKSSTSLSLQVGQHSTAGGPVTPPAARLTSTPPPSKMAVDVTPLESRRLLLEHSWSFNTRELRKFFRDRIGAGKELDLLKGPLKDSVIVQFATAEDAARALNECNGREVEGRKVTLRPYREGEESRPSLEVSMPYLTGPALGLTVLHFAYCIAAMDEAGNAESIAKADRLHSIALLQFPFLLHLYEPSTSTIHLVHPINTGTTASPPHINAFLFAPHRAKDRMWALLYFVWRILRRTAGGSDRRRVTASRVTARPLWQLERWYGGNDWTGEGVAMVEAKRRFVRLRVEREEEVRVLRRMLREEPWGMMGAAEDEEWPLQEIRVGQLMPSFTGRKRAGENNERLPGTTAEMMGPGWESGWAALFSHIEHEDTRLPCLRIPGEAWEECIQR